MASTLMKTSSVFNHFMIYGVLENKIKLENGKGVQVKNFQL